MGNYQIAYLPYLKAKRFILGNVNFAPFDEEAKGLFEDAVLNYLNWFFSKHVDMIGRPKRPMVLGFKDQFLGPWTDDQVEEMRDTVALLCFLSIWRTSESCVSVTDDFALYFKNFDPDTRWITTSGGGYVRKQISYAPDVVDKVFFVDPEYVTSPDWSIYGGPWAFAEPLFNGIHHALISSYREDWFLRFIRSVKVVNASLHNSHELGYHERTLLLVTGFETFFECDTSNQNKFANAIGEILRFESKEGFSEKIPRRLRKFSIHLYEARSRYVHGNKMKPSDLRHQTYGDIFRVGLRLFGLVSKHTLISHGAIECLDHDLELYRDIALELFVLMEETSHRRDQLDS